MSTMNKAVVILAGGTGKRLWPLSTKSSPKQFLKLFSEKSLLRETYERLAIKFEPYEIFVSITSSAFEQARVELPELPESNFICEPVSMDTMAAIGLISSTISLRDSDTAIYLAQCDHHIPKPEELCKVQDIAFQALEQHPDKIFAIGTNPDYPETSFGYIEMGEPIGRIESQIIFTKSSFKEKPDASTAQEFVRSWKYLWNMGNYAFVAKTMLQEYKRLVPETYEVLMEYRKESDTDKQKELFTKCQKTSFDYGIAEHSENIWVIPAELSWIDVANWRTVQEVAGERMNTNVIDSVDASDNLVVSRKKVVLVGVHKIAVVETDSAILVCALDKAGEVKKVVERLPEDLQ